MPSGGDFYSKRHKFFFSCPLCGLENTLVSAKIIAVCNSIGLPGYIRERFEIHFRLVSQGGQSSGKTAADKLDPHNQFIRIVILELAF